MFSWQTLNEDKSKGLSVCSYKYIYIVKLGESLGNVGRKLGQSWDKVKSLEKV